ncbi:glutaredoxin domain-containing protein [Lysinibacillus telephonicus]|uniref:Glutaredoxin n=1 Tax=Lysinibacillus telephonicus TaxID=1714840 RepID=A0A3S0HE85_9BACI|nr:glutaredoxin domain-containing protein [Lysinibacillus telephonicus]RTQ89456.1 glutaredoxin [Lysinibacillus telephonicus]
MKLYTKTICPKCMLMKFELNKAGFEGDYEIINIEQNEQAKNKLVEAGILSVPVLEINGRLIQDITEMKDAISRILV